MPNGDFLNPRYRDGNEYLTNRQLKKKYGYVPRINSDDYDCEKDYLGELEDAREHGYEDDERYP